MAKTKNPVVVKVIETNEVTYRRNEFLFFRWSTFESATRVGRNIIIETNDDIDAVVVNGQTFLIK